MSTRINLQFVADKMQYSAQVLFSITLLKRIKDTRVLPYRCKHFILSPYVNYFHTIAFWFIYVAVFTFSKHASIRVELRSNVIRWKTTKYS